MNRNKALASFLLFALIWPPVPQLSIAAASLNQLVRNLAQGDDQSNPKPVQEISPSPSPDPAGPKPKSGDDKVDANSPNAGVVVEETCDMNFNKCHGDVQNVTACLLAKAGDASSGLFLLIRNDGENALTLNVTILPVNESHVGDTLGHKVRKINVSSNAGRWPSIVLNAPNWTCTIRSGVRVPLSFPSYIANIKPINGAYVLFGTALLIGVLWACFKLGKDVRHLNGVPYQELEMGQQEIGSSVNVETVDGWDQSWDDDDNWDEEKAVKSPIGNHVGLRRANGDSSRSSDANGWGSDWND